MSFWADAWSWFWLMLWMFVELAFLFAIIYIVFDIFRDHALSGWQKAGWVILVVFFPFLGAIIYLIARGSSMGERMSAGRGAAPEDDDYTPRASSAPADEITRAAELRDQGTITDGEFEAIKSKALTGRY